MWKILCAFDADLTTSLSSAGLDVIFFLVGQARCSSAPYAGIEI